MEVKAELLQPREEVEVALYLASYENWLISRVAAGENRGRTLTHGTAEVLQALMLPACQG